MVRGKPFYTSVDRLVKAGVMRKPVWSDIVDATRPPFEPVTTIRTKAIRYPEDRLRNKYFRRNPETRRIPVNLKARSIVDRHIADRFVTIQMGLMRERNISEEEAYSIAKDMVNLNTVDTKADRGSDFYGPLSDPTIENETARLYLASVKDSERDKQLYDTICNQSLAYVVEGPTSEDEKATNTEK